MSKSERPVEKEKVIKIWSKKVHQEAYWVGMRRVFQFLITLVIWMKITPC